MGSINVIKIIDIIQDFTYLKLIPLTPTVSIIIPVYNTEKWLQRCLESVLAQSFQNYEVILIDDGSSDLSPAILDNYASKDSRFRVFHEKNRGSSLARQFGISKARGNWLVFVDSDDDVHPLYLQHLFEAASQNGTSMAICDMQKVSNDSIPAEIKTIDTIILDQQSLHMRFFKYQFWGFGGKIYKKELFNDIYFPPYNINEDYVVMAQIFTHQKRVAYIPEALYYYRNNPNSQSHIKLTPRIMDEYYNKKWVVDYYAANMPKYTSPAKEQLAESCIKLIGIIKSDDMQGLYSNGKIEAQRVLKKNLLFILFSSNMLLGLKLMAMKLVLFG